MTDDVVNSVNELAATLQAEGVPSTPSAKQVEEVDRLKYLLYRARIYQQQLLLESYAREVQRVQAELNRQSSELTKFSKELEAKYETDMRANSITEDGYLVPLQQMAGQRF